MLGFRKHWSKSKWELSLVRVASVVVGDVADSLVTCMTYPSDRGLGLFSYSAETFLVSFVKVSSENAFKRYFHSSSPSESIYFFVLFIKK